MVLATHHVRQRTTILSKFIHEEAISAAWRVMVAAPVMPQLVTHHTYHFKQNHLLSIIVVGAESSVEDDGARGRHTKI